MVKEVVQSRRQWMVVEEGFDGVEGWVGHGSHSGQSVSHLVASD